MAKWLNFPFQGKTIGHLHHHQTTNSIIFFSILNYFTSYEHQAFRHWGFPSSTWGLWLIVYFFFNKLVMLFWHERKSFFCCLNSSFKSLREVSYSRNLTKVCKYKNEIFSVLFSAVCPAFKTVFGTCGHLDVIVWRMDQNPHVRFWSVHYLHITVSKTNLIIRIIWGICQKY